MIPTWFAAVVILLGAFSSGSQTVASQMILCVFGAAAAFDLPALGGANVTPAVAFLPFLAFRAWTEGRPLWLRRVPKAGFWLTLAVIWGVVSAVAIPRLFTGWVNVETFDRSGGGDGIFPLHPVSGNVTQAAYAIGNVITFFSMRTLLGKAERLHVFARAVLLLTGVNCAAAALNLVEYYTGMPSLLALVRTANYTMYDAYDFAGLIRIHGTFMETSIFSAFTLPLFAFTSSLWFSEEYGPAAGRLALISLVFLLLSTSGTAYAGLVIYLSLVALGLLWRRMATGRIPRHRELEYGVGASGLLIGAVSIYTLAPIARVADFFGTTLFGKLQSGSGLMRSSANNQAWSNFIDTYGLGVGLGTTKASSFAIVLVSNLGVIGAGLFLAFLGNVLRAPGAESSAVVRAARAAVLAALIAACTSGTVFDLGVAFFAFAAAATVEERDILSRVSSMASVAALTVSCSPALVPSSVPAPEGSEMATTSRASASASGVAAASADRPRARETTDAVSFGDTIGLNVQFALGEPESDVTMLADLGVRWVRDGVMWHELEPSPGAFRLFPGAFARRLEYYKAHDIGVVFLLAYENKVAYPQTPRDPLRPIDPVAFGRYASEVARQLRVTGVRFVLEIWNEPSNFTVRKLAGGAWNGTPPSPWVDAYVRIVNETVAAVKSVDPAITVLDDDDMWLLHYRFLQVGLSPRLDGFAFHPYNHFGPERAAVGPDSEWAKPFQIVDQDSSFESAVVRLRDAGAKHLAVPPQMWITEWGWKLGDEGPAGPIAEDTVVAFLPRAYVMASNARVRATLWFALRDWVDGPWGLITKEGRKRSSYFAFQALTRQLGELRLVRQVIGADHKAAGHQAFLFCAVPQTDCKLVVWTIDLAPVRLRLVGPLAAAVVVDALGSELRPSIDSDGSHSVPIGQAPVYVSPVPTQGVEWSSFISPRGT